MESQTEKLSEKENLQNSLKEDPGLKNDSQPINSESANTIDNPSLSNQEISLPVKTDERPKLLFVIVFLVIAILIVLVFVLFPKLFKKGSEKPTENSALTPTVALEPTSPVEIRWLNYANKKYFYDLSYPSTFTKQAPQGQGKNEEQLIEFVKTDNGMVTKLSIYLTTPDIIKDTLSVYKKALENKDIGESVSGKINSTTATFKKRFVSNFLGYQSEYDTAAGNVQTIIIEKTNWIYSITAEASDKNDKDTLEEIISKIRIYDSQAEFLINNNK